MLFRLETLRGIEAGEVTLAFRRWRHPTVRAGGTLRTRVGVLAIESVEPVKEAAISDAEARRAGAADRAEVIAQLRPGGTLYRIEFRLAGPDPRIALRERADLDDEERAAIDARLARFDAASRHGPWTARVLDLIAERPATRAPELAAELGRETVPSRLTCAS